VADILTMESPAPVPGEAISAAAADAGKYSNTGDMIRTRMPELVKGAGFVTGNAPLSDSTDIAIRSHEAALKLRVSTNMGYTNKSNVVKGMSQDFLGNFGYLKAALSQPSIGEQLQQMLGGTEIGKSFTAGNLGIGSVYGLVPFDLRAPSRLIYPVYTVLRNKLPRPAGQGTSMQERVFTGISGSGTGGQGVLDISTSELTGSTSFSSWPLNLPQAGSQTEVSLNVPYRFFGLTEQLSFLAQFAGQGFEDISALANLILLQEMMLGEEYMMLAGTSAPLATPAAPTTTLRAAGSNETAIGGSPSHFVVAVTAVNYYGESLPSAVSSDITTVGTTNVVDVTIKPVAGAQSYNIYVATASATPTNSQLWLQVGSTTQAGVVSVGSQSSTPVGGKYITIQGPAASAGAHPPTADTGTGKGTRMEGVIPTLTGASASAGIYPSGWQGGYVNQSVGTHLSYSAVYAMLDGLWETNGTNTGAFKADPAELIGNGGDIMRLSNDVISQGNATNYRLFLDQPDVSGVRVGAAVSQFQNPITKSILNLTVHPWLTQGTAMAMTYQLPQTWSNVANAWEMTTVQDYVSIAWPVIDATFRYSIFLYGALTAHAPQYSGILQGLQVSDTTPFS
jgi:hypothetical protein